MKRSPLRRGTSQLKRTKLKANGETRRKRQRKYQAHLRSAKWKMFVKVLIMLRGPYCEECKQMDRLHGHHKTYARFGNELPEDVQLLCERCHAMKDSWKGNRPRIQSPNC